MNDLTSLTTQLRRDILTISTKANSGHPTSSLSAVEVLAVLFHEYFRYDLQNITNPANDRFILSKGHATPLLYSVYAAFGFIKREDLTSYRMFESNLEGHPTPRLAFTEAATGSLGQGLAVAAGQALALRSVGVAHRDETETGHSTASQLGRVTLPRVFCLLGDGELAEGSVWEAASFASYYQLSNLITIVDVNALGQSGPTQYGHSIDVIRRRFESFGFASIVIDGHNTNEVDGAFEKAITYTAGPSVILAKTIKGKGVAFFEGKEGWHGKPLPEKELSTALEGLGGAEFTYKTFPLRQPDIEAGEVVLPEKEKEISVHIPATKETSYMNRKAFGEALVAIAQHHAGLRILDGDVKNSTYTELLLTDFPDTVVESFIAEQTMVGVAAGLAKRGFSVWVSTFGAFLTRAFDQIRMANYSGVTIHFNGSHAGVSIGEDGPSQMALEDLAMFRTLEGSTVVYPSDYYCTMYLTAALMNMAGVSYLRTTRSATPVLYAPDETFPIGGSKVHAEVKGKAKAAIVAAGITLYEALAAQKELADQGTAVRVIDTYSVKPIDVTTLTKAVKDTGHILVVEDHNEYGGLGDAVLQALAGQKFTFTHLAVRKTPRSGKPEELLAYEEIDMNAIIKAIK